MFVFLSKLLPPLVYPIGLAIIFLALALLFRRKPRLRTLLEIATLALLLLFSNQWVSTLLVRSLEWRYLPTGEIPQADAIVLLGGGTAPQSFPRTTAELNGAGDRLLLAAELYRQGKAPVILVSGGNVSWVDSQSSNPAKEMTGILNVMGVPSSAIWQEDQSQNTYQNAVFYARILKEKQITRVILVTSAMHMPRSVGLFRKQGIEVIPAPADFQVTPSNWGDLSANPQAWVLNLLPSAGSLSTTSTALKEYLGMLVYHLRGWM